MAVRNHSDGAVTGITISKALIDQQTALPQELAQLDDGSLVAASIAGDRGAFGILVERYKTLVIGTSYRKVGNLEDAKDLAQETFISSYRALRRLKNPQRFKPWLMTIAGNHCIDFLRRQHGNTLSLDEERGDDDAVSLHERLSSPAKSGAQAVTSETTAIIVEAIESLPERYRGVVYLRYIEDLTPREIADKLHITPMACRQRLCRANKRLRKKLHRVLLEED
ncbi:MAG: sigma-70 family RNA polymerase sigma factor [bacterium]